MKPETRSLTVVDLLLMTVGIAIGMTTPGLRQVISPDPDHSYFTPEAVFRERMIYLTAVGLLALSIVALGRVARHRRKPWPVEWLAIVTCVYFFMGELWREFDNGEFLLGIPLLDDRDSPRRWWVVVIGLLVVLAGSLFFRILRRSLDPIWMTASLVGSLPLLLWAPVGVIRSQSMGWTYLGCSFRGRQPFPLAWAIAQWAVFLPAGLLHGVPAIGSILDRFAPRRWTWVEWFGLSLSALLFASGFGVWFTDFDPSDVLGDYDSLIAAGWLATVVVLSSLIRAWVGPIGRFWYVDSQPEHSTPIVISPDITA